MDAFNFVVSNKRNTQSPNCKEALARFSQLRETAPSFTRFEGAKGGYILLFFDTEQYGMHGDDPQGVSPERLLRSKIK